MNASSKGDRFCLDIRHRAKAKGLKLLKVDNGDRVCYDAIVTVRGMRGAFLLAQSGDPGPSANCDRQAALGSGSSMLGRTVMDETDKAWMAGIFDGEGSVHIGMGCWSGRIHDRRRGKHYFQHNQRLAQLRVMVSNTDPRMVSHIHRLTGFGTLRESKRKEPHNRRQWRWEAATQQAAAFLALILPYLIVKREAATKALEFAVFQAKQPHKTKRGDGDGRWERYEQFRSELRQIVDTRPILGEIPAAPIIPRTASLELPL